MEYTLLQCVDIEKITFLVIKLAKFLLFVTFHQSIKICQGKVSYYK